MSDDLKDVIRRIKEQADIVAVVGRVVPLTRAGTSYKGLCPFHKEKTPSFNVVPAKGIYHCFGCKAGGSVVDFVMNTEKLEFMEALKRLADDLGIEVPAAGRRGEGGAESEDRRRSLIAANEFALKWMRENLLKNRNPVANAYMQKRGITPELAEKFALGAALDDWATLREAAKAKGFSDELLLEVGLCKRNEERGTVYDRLRHRLIFPIRDHMGRPVGFGGRRLREEGDEAKYLNSPETPLYSKGRTLYALDIAGPRISETGYAIITEGYMDTIMAHRYGFGQTVASLGTALTAEQARLLKRYASRAVFLYDGDDAGRNAMLRAGEALLAAGIDTRVVLLPKEDDPDTFLLREGAQALQRLIEHAQEYFEFAVGVHAAGLELTSLSGQAELVEKTAPLLAAMTNDVQREAGISRLLGRLGSLPREAVYRILDRRGREGRAPATAPEPQQREAPAALDQQESFALRLMIESEEALDILRAHIHIEWLGDTVLEPWLMYLLSHDGDAATLLAHAEAEGMRIGEASVVPQVLADTRPLGDAKEAARQLAVRLKLRHHRKVAREMVEAIREKYREDPSGVPEGLMRLLHEETKLTASIKVPSAAAHAAGEA